MIPIRTRLALGFLDDSVSSANMGAISNKTRKNFSLAHENRLSNQILELSYCWRFPIMHLLCFILPNQVFAIFSLLKISVQFILGMNNVKRVFCNSKYHDLLTISSVCGLTVPLERHMKLFLYFFCLCELREYRF